MLWSFFDRIHQRLYFSRDALGRRSLVYRISDSGSIVVASISDGDTSKSWNEVEADGIYAIDCSIPSERTVSVPFGLPDRICNASTFPVTRYPWVNSTHMQLPDALLGLVSSPLEDMDCSWWLSPDLACLFWFSQ